MYKHWTVKRAGILELEETKAVNVSDLAPDTVLLRHLSAIVCFSDVSVVDLTYFRKLTPPFTPGYSFVGIVEGLGPNTSAPFPRGCPPLNKGDIVLAMVATGGWARHSVWKTKDGHKNLVKVPFPVSFNSPTKGSLDLAQLTAVILNTTTAKQLISRTGLNLKDGDSVLVHSAAGGVGSALCELLRLEHPGVHVLGTCSPQKSEFVKNLSATPIDYRAEPFEQAVARIMKERGKSDVGLRAVFDGVGGDSFARSYSCLSNKSPSKLVMFGNTGGSGSIIGPIASNLLRNVNFLSTKSTTFFGVVLDREKKPEVFAEDLNTVMKYVVENKIDPFVEAVVDFDNVKAALKFVKEGKSKGNIVLLIDDEVKAQYASMVRSEF